MSARGRHRVVKKRTKYGIGATAAVAGVSALSLTISNPIPPLASADEQPNTVEAASRSASPYGTHHGYRHHHRESRSHQRHAIPDASRSSTARSQQHHYTPRHSQPDPSLTASASASSDSTPTSRYSRQQPTSRTSSGSAHQQSSASGSARSSASSSAAAAPASPKAQPSTATSGSERVINTAYITAYTYYDNTPAGSAAISHPVLHNKAGGSGTYADPITIAVGHDLSSGRDVLDYPAGTRIYIPDYKRYFIVEDTCGDGGSPEDGPCHNTSQAPGNASTWLDVWIGGSSGSESQVQSCANQVTGVRTIIVNPSSNHPVTSGDVFSGGGCLR